MVAASPFSVYCGGGFPFPPIKNNTFASVEPVFKKRVRGHRKNQERNCHKKEREDQPEKKRERRGEPPQRTTKDRGESPRPSLSVMVAPSSFSLVVVVVRTFVEVKRETLGPSKQRREEWRNHYIERETWNHDKRNKHGL